MSNQNPPNIEVASGNHGRYPITRYLLYYTAGDPKGAAAKFLRWATTDPKALEIIEQVGFVAVQPDDATPTSRKTESEVSVKAP